MSDDVNSVLIQKDYGKVRFHFSDIMDQKNINRNMLARKANINFSVATRFYEGNIERLDIDVLTRVCYVLGCEISDVIEYVKP